MTHAEVNFGNMNHIRKRSMQLDARFMLPDHRECECKVAGVSVDGALFITAERPAIGTVLIAYIDGIGRAEGRVEGLSPAGLLVRFKDSETQRSRIRDQLKMPESGEQRRAPRVVLQDTHSILVADGQSVPCVVRDISLTGAALLTSLQPALSTVVFIGRMKARVVRHFEGGIAIEFIPQADA